MSRYKVLREALWHLINSHRDELYDLNHEHVICSENDLFSRMDTLEEMVDRMIDEEFKRQMGETPGDAAMHVKVVEKIMRKHAHDYVRKVFNPILKEFHTAAKLPPRGERSTDSEKSPSR